MTQSTSSYDESEFVDNNNNSLGFINDAKKVKRNALIRNNKDFTSLASPTLNKRYRFSVLPTVI